MRELHGSRHRGPIQTRLSGELSRAYEAACRRAQLRIRAEQDARLRDGAPHRHQHLVKVTRRSVIGEARAPSDRRQRRRKRLLIREIREQADSIHRDPKAAGCSLGGLDWRDVRPRIEQAIARLQDRALVFAPQRYRRRKMVDEPGTPGSRRPAAPARQALSTATLPACMDPFVLFRGPQADVLRARGRGTVASSLREGDIRAVRREPSQRPRPCPRGYMLSRTGDRRTDPEKESPLVPSAVDGARGVLSEVHAQARFDRVARGSSRWSSKRRLPFGVELLATVHWVMTRERAETDDAVVQRVHAWGARKQAFSPRQIELTAARLRALGWWSQANEGTVAS